MTYPKTWSVQLTVHMVVEAGSVDEAEAEALRLLHSDPAAFHPVAKVTRRVVSVQEHELEH